MRSIFLTWTGSAALIMLSLLHGSGYGQGMRSSSAGRALHQLIAAEWDYEMAQHPTWA